MIVADANTLLYLVCDTPLTELARQVHAADPAWVAPALWEAEVLNGLLGMRRRGWLDLADAVQAWRCATAALAGRVHASDASAILRTAEETGLSAYDAHYVELARSLGVWLVTEDQQVLRRCPDVARSLRAFLTPEGPAVPGAH